MLKRNEMLENKTYLKKFIICLFFMLTVGSLIGCKKEEIVYLGIDAEIIEIDLENSQIEIEYMGETQKSKKYIDCTEAIEAYRILYCNYETGDVETISIKDLKVGDEIILGFEEEEYSKIDEESVVKVMQIQLATQRLS